MTLTTTASTAVTLDLLYAESRRVIARAAGDLWPDSRVVLGPRYPSVTSYVCQVTVDGKKVIATYSWLGMSLVPLLRGRAGTWEQVREAQSRYVRSTALLTARQAHHLNLLRTLGRLPVCETAGLRGGVLFTRKVPGPTLADALTARPEETGTLLDTVLFALRDLHGRIGAGLNVAPIGERAIAGVFRRKFGSAAVGTYLRTLGRDNGLPEQERQDAVRLMANSVARLRGLAGVLSPLRSATVYGDLTPEHVHLAGLRPRFIDPALHPAAGPEPDIAKLAGRTLLLALGRPQPQAGVQIVQGVAATVALYLAGLPARERARRCRELLVLLLMDMVNLATTCLSTPPGLDLPDHHRVLITRARTVAALTDRVSALLIGSMTGPRLLETAFDAVEQAVSDR